MYTPAASKSGTKIIATRPKRWPNSAAVGQVCSDELSFVSGFKTPSQNAIAVRWVAKVILSNNLSCPAICPMLLKDQIAMRPPNAEIQRPWLA